MSRVLRAAPLILVYLPAQRNRRTAMPTPQTETPLSHSTQKSEPLREKGEPLTCSLYKQSGGSSGFSPHGPAFSLQREYLSVVTEGGGHLEVAGPDFCG